MIRIYLIISIYFLIFSPIASAFELKPLYASLAPSGAGAEKVFRINNSGDKPIAVQFKTTTREQRPNGSEIQSDSDDLFMIYPPQAVIPAHKTQKVRVQWLGEQNPKKELAYRFIAEQVPVKLSKSRKNEVQMVMTLVGSIYIEPKGVNHQLDVSNIRRSDSKLVFTVRNTGTKHAMLEGLTMNLFGDAQQVKLSGKQVFGAEGKNILAGSYRDLSIPFPQGISPNKNWQAKLNF